MSEPVVSCVPPRLQRAQRHRFHQTICGSGWRSANVNSFARS